MKKKKGFTLIELLAVIVILAIIALIATPIIMNVIDNVREGAAQRSAENYISAIETAIMKNRMNKGFFLVDGTYDLAQLEYYLGEIEVNGKKTTDETILIKDGQVADGTSFKINDKVVNITNRKTKIGKFDTVVDILYDGEEEKSIADFIKGQTTTFVLYNPVTQRRCHQANPSKNCFQWYVLEDKGSDYEYASLIALFYPNTNSVSWCGDNRCKKNKQYTNEYGPITAMEFLKENTKDWAAFVSLPSLEQLEGLGTIEVENGNEMIKLPSIYSNEYFWTSTIFPSDNQRVYSVIAGGINKTHGKLVREFYNVRVFPVITVKKSTLSKYI